MNKVIFVLEDNSDLLFALEEIMALKRPDYKIFGFTNGIEAWEELSSVRRTYDAIVLDNMVPGISGMDIAKKIMDNESLKHIPIIMQSGKIETHIKQVALDNGVKEYLTKPYSLASFINVLDEILMPNPA